MPWMYYSPISYGYQNTVYEWCPDYNHPPLVGWRLMRDISSHIIFDICVLSPTVKCRFNIFPEPTLTAMNITDEM